MIIFYEKETGKIIGTIEGRVHSNMHLNQWIGDKEKTERLIINWIKNESGVYEPDLADLEQKDIALELDKNPISIYDYRIDIILKKIRRK
jgi:hypothetical protein